MRVAHPIGGFGRKHNSAKATQRVNAHETKARDKFDKWSNSSDFQQLRPWLAYVQRHVLDEIDWSRTTTVLDVACGSGWAVHEAARRLQDKSDGRAYGCDISEGMLHQREIGASAPKNTAFLAASAQMLPYAENRFDAVICTAAFHHFPVPHQALHEILRVLRPGGTLLIADTCRDQSVGTWIWDRLHRWFEKGHVKYYRRDELAAILHGAEYRRIEPIELQPTYAETKKVVGKIMIFKAMAPNASDDAGIR